MGVTKRSVGVWSGIGTAAAITVFLFGGVANAYNQQWQPPNLTTVSAGTKQSCAVADGAAYCWGAGTGGVLGNGGTGVSLVPVAVDASGVLSGKTVTAISTGTSHTCAVASGAAYCWGDGSRGQLGNASTSGSLVPVAVNTSGVLGGKTVTAISAGSYFTCAVAGGAAYCWGYNTNGQLGNSSFSQSTSPVAVTAGTGAALKGKTIIAISAGTSHTCTVSSSGAAYCWGDGIRGELGNSSTSDSNQPVAVYNSGALNFKTVTAISAGNLHTCAVASGGAYCWGYNNKGQLGDSSTTDSSVPVAVDTSGVLGGKTATAIGAGNLFTCAVASGGAYCWGYNYKGQLGNSSTTDSSGPVAVNTSGVLSGKTATTISAGDLHTCAVASGAAYCWGDNTNKQLGLNSYSITSSAVPLSPVIYVSSTGDNYRFYDTSATISPGSPLGTMNQAVGVAAGASLRLHIGIQANSNLPASQVNYMLEYAVKTAATCSAQTTGFSAITTVTPIAWYDPGSPANGAVISASTNDPTFSGTTVYENYVSGGTSFTDPTQISSGQYGLWSFSLKNNSTDPSASYCLNVAYSDGTALDSYTQYPEVGTTASAPSIGFVDNSGNPVATPVFAMSGSNVMTSCQSSTGTMGSSGGQKMRITQAGSAGSGWNVAIAPTAGDTATWNDSANGKYYDFNDGAGSPPGCYAGSDGDTYAGQLSINSSTSALAPKSGCSTTGLSLATGSTAFVNGTTSAITLVSSSSASQSNCYWDLYSTQFSQKIPPAQPAGSYIFNLTATVTAS